MRLAVDIGNTAVKWAAFEGERKVESGERRTENGERKTENGEWEALLEIAEKAEQTLVCASGEVPQELSHLPRLDATTPLPIKLNYKTPATLGPDRIAAACGAWALHRGEASLIVDAGTCITVDFLDANGVYHGGAIMPGIRMNLNALHTFTAKLPLVDITDTTKARVPGRSTEECIVAGTLGTAQMALASYVALYKGVAPGLRVIATGGDAALLVPQESEGHERVAQLSLIGLNEIMINNER